MVRLLEDIAEFLGKKGDELYQELKKLLDKLLAWIKKNKKRFEKVETVNPTLLSYIRILKRNKDYKTSLEYIKLIRRPLGRWLPLEQEAAVNLYTKSYYLAFNKALRKLKGHKMTSEFKAMQKVLDDALDKLPVSDYNKGILQRSAYFTEREIKKMFKMGKDFVDEGYFSTTHSEEALYKWMTVTPTDNVLFKVQGKNGKLIEASSNIPDEAEILFKSKTAFTVESVKPGRNPINELEEITIIILREK